MKNIEYPEPVVTITSRTRTALVVVAILAGLFVPLIASPSWTFQFALVLVYAILAISVIVSVGWAGQLIICQGALFGIGAYGFVLLSSAGLWGPIALLVATVLPTLTALVIGRVAIRASGIYLGIITLAFNELFVQGVTLLPEHTGGTTGLASAPLFPSAVTDVVGREVALYYLLCVGYLLVLLLARRITGSKLGWALASIKADRNVAESIGVPSKRYRLYSFLFTGWVCGFAGALYAPLVGYISPSMFDLHATISIMLAGVAGGLMQPVGSVVGAAVVVLLPEVLRPIADFRLIVYGTFLIGILAYFPDGIVGKLRRHVRIDSPDGFEER